MRVRRSLQLFAIAWLACGVWLGCNALLGNESAEFDPDAAARLDATTNDDGTAPGDGSTTDGAGGDANPDGSGDGGDGGGCTGLDFTTNAENCGACGHSCRGGACTGSKCQPVILATDDTGPTAITVDGTHVYWINGTTGNVFSVPIDGGAKVPLYDGPDDTGGTNIIARGGNVYFGVADIDAGVVRCAAPDCDGGPAFEVANLDVPGSIAITDAGVLYFAQTVNGGTIESCQLPCGSGRDTVVAATGFPGNVAVNGNDVYWTTITPFPPRMRTKDINNVPVGIHNGPVESILPTPNEVFFIEQAVGPSAIQPDGGGLRRLTEGTSPQGKHMVFFGSSVLVTEANKNFVYTCALAGCGDAGVIIAADQKKPRGVAFDATYIYWANEGTAGSGGSIMRLAR